MNCHDAQFIGASVHACLTATVGVMGMFVDGEAIWALDICIRSRQVGEDRRGPAEPCTPSASNNSTQHIPASTRAEIHLSSNTRTDYAHPVFIQPQLSIFILDNCFGKATFAAVLLAPTLAHAILHGLPLSVFVKLMPMMLDMAEDKLGVSLKFHFEALGIFFNSL